MGLFRKPCRCEKRHRRFDQLIRQVEELVDEVSELATDISKKKSHISNQLARMAERENRFAKIMGLVEEKKRGKRFEPSDEEEEYAVPLPSVPVGPQRGEPGYKDALRKRMMLGG